MTKSQLYRKAAKSLSNGKRQWCCSAITEVGLSQKEFLEWFSPYEGADNRLVWFGMVGVDEHQIARSLALLFLAEIVKEEA